RVQLHDLPFLQTEDRRSRTVPYEGVELPEGPSGLNRMNPEPAGFADGRGIRKSAAIVFASFQYRYQKSVAASSGISCQPAPPRLIAPVRRALLYRARGPSVSSEPSNQRSEEHTSELQSRFDLVCRLLL